MNDPRVVDVLIAGAGPTGTALAIDLARRGLAIRIVDKSPHAFEGSRAKGVQPRTLEVLDDLGASSAVLAAGSIYPKLGIHLGPVVVPWTMFKIRGASSDVPYPNTWLVPQFRTDAALHARLAELGTHVEFGKEVVDFTQDASCVKATLATDGGHEEITARYFVGADGGASPVRTKLGIDFGGSTDEEDRILIVDATTTGLSRNRWHVWPIGGKFIGACPLPNSELFQWMIRLRSDETPPESLDEIRQRIRSHTRSRRIELHDIQWRSVFRPNIRLAESYQRGRILIAGDAAHVHTPAGAQGLNTGIQDAYNLGWKLGQVLAGADRGLLDTYQAERQPIAAGVLGLSTEKYEAIGKLDPASIKRGKDEQQLALSYRDGPLTFAVSGTRTLSAGDRAPDAVLSSTGDDQVRLFDLFRGPHFTGIALGPRAADALSKIAWPAAGAALKRVVIDVPEARGDVHVRDQNGSFKRAYGVTDDSLFLVRPDGYIAVIAVKDFETITTIAGWPLTPSQEVAKSP